MEMNKMILQIQNVTKTFPGVKALDNVSLQVHEGEVLALLGENGAGKSTLINILSGVYPPDKGLMFLDGEEVRYASPRDAKARGISVVHQELSFLPLLSVAENLYVNHYGTKKSKLVSWKEVYEYAEAAVAGVGLKIDIKRPIGMFSVAERQQIEIARAIHENARILILDEPTSALNDREINILMNCIGDLRARGVSVILITHKIEEIKRIADRVIVLRDGAAVAERKVDEVQYDDLVSLMVGRKISDMYPRKTNVPGKVRISVKDLKTKFLKDISFEVREGEVFGVYGLMGSGHLELGETLFGCIPQAEAELTVSGDSFNLKSPTDSMKNGIAFLPSDRKLEGLVMMHSVCENIMTPSYQVGSGSSIIKHQAERAISDKWIKALSIKTPGGWTKAEALSGGNQQKVVLAKWLEINPRLIILNDPTRGIDVGAKTEIYKLLNELTCKGVSVVMITSELPELIAMSDRVLVMYNGTQAKVFEKHEICQEDIVNAAIGGYSTT